MEKSFAQFGNSLANMLFKHLSWELRSATLPLDSNPVGFTILSACHRISAGGNLSL
jgi:hypothetical protein